MKKIFVLITIIVLSQNIIGQSIAKGIKLFEANKRKEALTEFEAVLKKKKNDLEANYFVGLIHFFNGDYGKAIPHIKVAADKNFRTDKIHLGAVEDSKFLLADAYFMNYDFSLAVEVLESMASKPNLHFFEAPNVVANFLNKAKLGQRLLEGYNPNEVVLIDSVVINSSDLLKVFPQEPNIGYLIESESNRSNKAFGFLSGKKDIKIFTQNDSTGGLNLYSSNHYLSGWSLPTLLSGRVNSEYDENYPSLNFDGTILYFASNNPQESLGGYDIFLSHPNSTGDFLKPRNIGIPFNSPFNDYLLVMDGNYSNIGYFVSDRYLPSGKVAIYTFALLLSSITDNIWDDTNRLKNSAKGFFLDQSFNTPAKNKLRDNIYNIHATDSSCEAIGSLPDVSQKNGFSFIVRDDKIYHSYADFTNEVALNKFEERQNKENQAIQTYNALTELRKEYSVADTSAKSDLGKTIKEYERELLRLKSEIELLTKTIRQLEN